MRRPKRHCAETIQHGINGQEKKNLKVGGGGKRLILHRWGISPGATARGFSPGYASPHSQSGNQSAGTRAGPPVKDKNHPVPEPTFSGKEVRRKNDLRDFGRPTANSRGKKGTGVKQSEKGQ